MSYNIYKSDGSTVIIPDGVVNQNFNNSTANAGKGIGVQIVGLTSTNYVVPTAQNFLQITENFCGAILPPDNKALQGQLWFNKLSSTTGKLYVRVSDALAGGLSNWREVVIGDTSVVPGSYSAANITVDSQGRVTSATNGSAGLPSQTGNNGKFLTTDGTNASWSDNTGFVPYYVPVSTTFTVPLYKQALFSIPIINDGTIIVDGYLVGV
jgi:hypothetical protein